MDHMHRSSSVAIKPARLLEGLPAELFVRHGALSGWLPVTLVRLRTAYGKHRWDVRPLGADREFTVDSERLRVPDFEYPVRRQPDPTGGYPHKGDSAYLLDQSY